MMLAKNARAASTWSAFLAERDIGKYYRAICSGGPARDRGSYDDTLLIAGKPMSALTRYAYSWIWCAPLLVHLLGWHLPLTELALWQSLWVLAWALLSRLHPLGQFWHDAWAGTRLISTPSAKARTQ